MLSQSHFESEQDSILNKDGHRFAFKYIETEYPGNGRKWVIVPAEIWSEPGEDFINPIYVTGDENKGNIVYTNRRGYGDIVENKERSIRRAKQKIVDSTRMAQLNRMVTLTSKIAIFDRQYFGKLVIKAIARMRIVTGNEIQYVCVLEKQKRGAWHAHVAVSGRQNFKLWISVWMRVLASVGTIGFVHVKNPMRHYTVASLANYLAKYIGKEIEETEFNKKSYWISRNIDSPVRRIRYFSTKAEALKFMLDQAFNLGYSITEFQKNGSMRRWFGDRHNLPSIDVVYYSTT
jgi:hypothetical protein